MYRPHYIEQVRLMVRCLPTVFRQDCFALKGGTAINLFVQDFPRASVDVDLVYLPIEPRDESLQGISDALDAIRLDLQAEMPVSVVTPHRQADFCIKLTVRTPGAVVKIEPNPTLRGSIHPPVRRDLVKPAEQLLEVFASAPTLAVSELYGGKICAALDRQHPRDLFDVWLLLQGQGITGDIRRSFVVYLASHNRPMNELLNPNPKDILGAFRGEFDGMTREAVEVETLIQTQAELPGLLLQSLDETERTFLLSLKRGEPEWDLLGIPGLSRMPALIWKLHNISRMAPAKHASEVSRLEQVLGV